MLAEAYFQTDQGGFILKDIKIPKGTMIKDLESSIIDALADKLILCNPELVFNLEEGTAEAKLTLSENLPFEVSIEHDCETEEDIEVGIQNGEILKLVYKEFVDYLLGCSFKLNVLP